LKLCISYHGKLELYLRMGFIRIKPKLNMATDRKKPKLDLSGLFSAKREQALLVLKTLKKLEITRLKLLFVLSGSDPFENARMLSIIYTLCDTLKTKHKELAVRIASDDEDGSLDAELEASIRLTDLLLFALRLRKIRKSEVNDDRTRKRLFNRTRRLCDERDTEAY